MTKIEFVNLIQKTAKRLNMNRNWINLTAEREAYFPEAMLLLSARAWSAELPDDNDTKALKSQFENYWTKGEFVLEELKENV